MYFHGCVLTLLNKSLSGCHKSWSFLPLLSGTQVAFKIKARPLWPRNVNLLSDHMVTLS